MTRNILAAALIAGLAGCQTIGGLTVKDYTAKSGARVMAGQAEPKGEYKCTRVADEKHEWGMKGNMDKAGASQRVTAAAVESAAARGANYAYVKPPAEVGIGAVNVNAFSDAQVTYYRCTDLPK